MRVQFNHPKQLLFLWGSDRALSAWSSSSRNGFQPSLEKPLEHTDDGILAAANQESNLRRGPTVQSKQEHLIARPRFSIARFPRAMAQFGLEGFIS